METRERYIGIGIDEGPDCWQAARASGERQTLVRAATIFTDVRNDKTIAREESSDRC